MEIVNQIKELLFDVETAIINKENTHKIMRKIHTLKGLFGSIGLKKAQRLMHLSEDILYGRKKIPSNLENILLNVINSSFALLENPKKDVKQLIAELETIANKNKEKTLEFQEILTMLNFSDEVKKLIKYEDIEKIAEYEEKNENIFEVFFKNSEITKCLKNYNIINLWKTDNGFYAIITSKHKNVRIENATVKPLLEAKTEEPQPHFIEAFRIDKKQLDKLLNLNNKLWEVTEILNTELGETKEIIELKSVCNELNELTTQMTLIDIENILSPIKNYALELANSLNKKVKVDINTNNLKIDKSFCENLRIALTHIIRNCVDHGIEPEDERIKNGKEKTGCIKIDCYISYNSLIIEIKDDGRGIDTDEILKKVIEKKLLPEDKARALSKESLLDFLFLDGFTTSDRITEISGRGEGMKIIKEKVEECGGKLKLLTEKNKGTTYILSLPLSLLKTLITRYKKNFLCFPVDFVTKVLWLNDFERINIEKVECIKLDKNVVPLLSPLPPFKPLKEGIGILLKTDKGNFCCTVNEVLQIQEVKVKPFDKIIKGADFLYGWTYLGKRKIGLIANPEAYDTKIRNLNTGYLA